MYLSERLLRNAAILLRANTSISALTPRSVVFCTKRLSIYSSTIGVRCRLAYHFVPVTAVPVRETTRHGTVRRDRGRAFDRNGNRDPATARQPCRGRNRDARGETWPKIVKTATARIRNDVAGIRKAVHRARRIKTPRLPRAANTAAELRE